MNLSKIAGTLVIAGMATAAFAVDGDFALKGNVQTQVTKSIADEDNNFSSGWIRANVGGQYKSENLDGTIMLRIFAPEFGNKIEEKNYDKILADLYWVNYKWVLGGNDKMNLKIGRWKTDWSQSTHFGTYLDKDLTVRGLWMRDYSHNAVELGWIHGLSSLNVMVAAKDGNANRGYLRVEEDMKFTFPLEMKFGYRGNLVDVVQNSAYLTHRVAATTCSRSSVPTANTPACTPRKTTISIRKPATTSPRNPSTTSRVNTTSRSTSVWTSPRKPVSSTPS